jgi:hypothetical protein
MTVHCWFCRSEGMPSAQREVAPYGDVGVLWTICRLHREELAAWRRAAEALTARLQAQAEGQAPEVPSAATPRPASDSHEKPQEPSPMQSPSSEGAGGGPLIAGAAYRHPEEGVEQP